MWEGVTMLILWHPDFQRDSIIPASSSPLTSRPSPFRLIRVFWQKMQERLHREMKMVPDPFLPTRGGSSPKWGP